MTINDQPQTELTPLQINVTKDCGTEPPFKNEFWDQHEQGIYVDIYSGKPLFASVHKFDSGTGWPSFTQPLPDSQIQEKLDLSHSMVRSEVRSISSNSHLGHVFKDGPGPSGLRYCINSAALKFIPKEQMAAKGYAKYLSFFEDETII